MAEPGRVREQRERAGARAAPARRQAPEPRAEPPAHRADPARAEAPGPRSRAAAQLSKKKKRKRRS